MTAGVDPGFLYRALTRDARRGGVVLLTSERRLDPGLRRFCDGLAEGGFEVAAISDAEVISAVRWAPGPVFLLSLGEIGAAAWSEICDGASTFAAASLFDPPLAALATGEPGRPTALHLTAERPTWPSHLGDLGERRPDVRAFPYQADAGFAIGDSDAAHLARLRTLQLFHRSAGAKGEMGG